MKEELQKELVEKYPEMFQLLGDSESRMPIMFGIETGDGWFDIIDALCESITEVCEMNDCKVPVVHQVKEKFGLLRFYIGPVNSEVFDEVHAMIRMAEKMTKRVCEECGSMDDVKWIQSGWWKVRCKEHRDEEEPSALSREDFSKGG